MHEQVSNKLAVLRGDIPNREAICFDSEPTVIIATVLLAVHIFTNDTIIAIQAWPPREPDM